MMILFFVSCGGGNSGGEEGETPKNDESGEVSDEEEGLPDAVVNDEEAQVPDKDQTEEPDKDIEPEPEPDMYPPLTQVQMPLTSICSVRSFLKERTMVCLWS